MGDYRELIRERKKKGGTCTRSRYVAVNPSGGLLKKALIASFWKGGGRMEEEGASPLAAACIFILYVDRRSIVGSLVLSWSTMTLFSFMGENRSKEN